MVACNAVLILTAFGLYYLGAETLRPWASCAHIVAGFALPVLVTFHIWLGRRRSKNRVARAIYLDVKDTRGGSKTRQTTL